MGRPSKTRILAAIRRAHGVIRAKPGDEPFADWWARHKAEERELEDRKLRLVPPRRDP